MTSASCHSPLSQKGQTAKYFILHNSHGSTCWVICEQTGQYLLRSSFHILFKWLYVVGYYCTVQKS